MESSIDVWAGAAVYDRIRSGDFSFDDVSGVVGPAVGPRWFLSAGFDLALMRERVLGLKNPVTLAGASAGALRFAAWVQPEPEKAYRLLMESYRSMAFSRRDTRESIQQILSQVIDSYVEDDAVSFALNNRNYRLAFTVARARHLLSAENPVLQFSGLVVAGLANLFSPSTLPLFFQRVLFYSGYTPPAFSRNREFPGMPIPLNEANFKRVLLASSSVPLRVAAVKNIYGAPRGAYRDGGLVDYHGNQCHGNGGNDVVLHFHHQERLVPTWFDGRLRRRTLPDDWTRNLLVVSPSKEFLEGLPGGKIPDRNDFKVFADNPGERLNRWERVIAASEPLGDVFMNLVAGGGIRHAVRRL